MKVIVTAGPTREYIDDVRFISNPSSGRMGYAVARAAAASGHEVVLISGPVDQQAPEGVQCVRVENAVEMRDAVQKAFGDCDCVVMAAAVGDYRPLHRVRGKIKKAPERLVLELVRNPDILAELGRNKGNRILVGFALEAHDPERNAISKLRSKNLDYVVLNSPAAFGADQTDVVILGRGGERVVLQGASKDEVARRIVDLFQSARQKANT